MVEAKKVHHRERKLKSYNVVDWLIIAFFSLYVLTTLIPVLNILSLSISDDYAALYNPGMLFPDLYHVTFDAYLAVIRSTAIYSSFFVSLATTLVATLLHILVTIFAGYALSIKKLPFRNVLMIFLLITMLFSGGLIPGYLTISSYGLIDTFWVLVVPGAVSAYSIILMKNFIIHIPESLKEAAEIDGANPFYILFKIIIPLSVPIIATLSLFCAVGKWNDWQTAFYYIKKRTDLRPFQNVLQTIVVNMDTSQANGLDLSVLGEAFKNALIVISVIPITILYLFAQKYFIKGLFIGSVKE